jgi:hypothetical protein
MTEQLLQELRHGLSDLVLVLDNAGTVVWVGGDAMATIGAEAAALRERSAADVLATTEEMRNWLGPMSIANREAAGTRAGQLRCPDGSRRDCEIRVRLVSTDARVVTIRVASHEARAQQAGRPRLLSPRTIHDLNNYLGIIIGFADIMLAAEPEGSERRKDLLEVRVAALAAIERLRSG